MGEIMDGSSKCPVIHGAITTAQKDAGTTNRDWWPNQLNTGILRQMVRAATQWILVSTTGQSFNSSIIVD